MDIEQPEADSIEAHVQALLNKGTPAETQDEPEPMDSDEDNPEEQDQTDVEEEATDDEERSEDEGEATDEDSREPSYTIKVDGKEKAVPLSELLSLAQKGDDYTQKTTKVAEERKALETEKAKIADLSTVRENYLNESRLLQEIIQGFSIPTERLDQLLKESKTEDYLKAKAHNEKIQLQVETLRKRDDKVKSEISEEQKAELARRETAEREALIATVPLFKDKAYTESFLKYVTDLGYTQEDVQNTLDHRLFVALDKARRFDEMQAKAKPVHKVPKVTEGKAVRKSVAELQSQKLRELATKAKRTGSREDHVALLLAKNSKGA